MKNLFFLILFCLLSISGLFAQDELSYPTDVTYYENGNGYFVSNWADGNGYVSFVDEDWQLISTLPVDLDFAGGLCLIDEVLYVVDNGDLWGGSLPSYLVAIDIVLGTELFRVEVSTGGTYLDLMTTDNNGNIFICDSEQLKIYKYNILTQQVGTFLEVGSKPLGICYNYIDDRLVFTESKSGTSYLKSVSPEGGEVTHQFDRPGWIEGITMDDAGNFYITSWSGASSSHGDEPVVKISHSFDFEYEMANDLNRPFGLCVGHDNYLVVCNWGVHNLYPIDMTLFSTEDFNSKEQALSVYPNPAAGKVNFRLEVDSYRQLSCTVHDLNGNIVHESSIGGAMGSASGSFDLSHLPGGLYFLVVRSEKSVYHERLILR